MYARTVLSILCILSSGYAEDRTPADQIRERLDLWTEKADAAKKAIVPAPPRHAAIVVGVGRLQREVYGFDGSLAGAVRDARAFRERFAAGGATAVPVLDEEATVSKVASLLRSAAKELASGDRLSLSFSGLGTILPDYNQSGRAPRNDTAWCLSDGVLGEDELFSILSEFRSGVRIDIYQDCGFSPSTATVLALAEGIAAGLHPLLNDREVLAGRIRVEFKAWLDKPQPEADFALPVRSLPERYRRRYVDANATLLSETQARISVETATGADLKATVRRISVCREDETCPDARTGGLLIPALPRTEVGDALLKELQKTIRPATSERLSPQVRRFGPKQ